MLPDKKPNVKIAVIGGGFVGITLAARLLEVENLHITVFAFAFLQSFFFIS